VHGLGRLYHDPAQVHHPDGHAPVRQGYHQEDTKLGPGLNLIEEDGRWKFIDMDKNEVQVEIVEGPPRKEENIEESLP